MTIHSKSCRKQSTSGQCICGSEPRNTVSGRVAGKLVIEIDMPTEPMDYGGANHLKIIHAIESVYPQIANRKQSLMRWEKKPESV